MARIFNNIFVRGLTGAVGDQFVIRKTRYGQTIIANKPMFDENREFTEAQLAQQKAFREAINYAKKAKTQPLYVNLAKGTNSSSYNIAVADWFGQPEVMEIDPSNWKGEVGQEIRLKAQDNVTVTRVNVAIRGDAGVIEEGEAVQSETDGLLWIYKPQTATSPTARLHIDAYAHDLPGNMGELHLQVN